MSSTSSWSLSAASSALSDRRQSGSFGRSSSPGSFRRASFAPNIAWVDCGLVFAANLVSLGFVAAPRTDSLPSPSHDRQPSLRFEIYGERGKKEDDCPLNQASGASYVLSTWLVELSLLRVGRNDCLIRVSYLSCEETAENRQVADRRIRVSRCP